MAHQHSTDQWSSTPVYRPTRPDGSIALFEGRLVVTSGGEEHETLGVIGLDKGVTGPLVAFVEGKQNWLFSALYGGEESTVSIPPEQSLQPPGTETPPSERGSSGWHSGSINVPRLTYGSAEAADCVVVHLAGPIPRIGWRQSGERGIQGSAFEVEGWSVHLIKLSEPEDVGFTHVARCRPLAGQVSEAALETLVWRLHILLGFISGAQITIGPVAGLAGDGRVVFGSWGSYRRFGTKPGAHWCTDPIAPDALGHVAAGMDALAASDPALLRIVDRGVGYLLSSSNSTEVLDIRVPTACTGLELIAWAVVQRQEILSAKELENRPAGALARDLLATCRIPSEVPEGFQNLSHRLQMASQPGWTGPDVVYKIRNQLMHPPKTIDDVEWPGADELLEAWQLGTWYLELAILNILGYDGPYWSRLRLGRYGSDTEPVPWASDGTAAQLKGFADESI